MKRSLTTCFLTASALTLFTPTAGAQDAPITAAEAELPTVTVEGVTIEAKPVARAKPKQAPASDASEASAPAAKKTKKVKPIQASSNSAASTAAAESAPASTAGDGLSEGAGAAAVAASSETGGNGVGVNSDEVGSAVSVVTGEQLQQRQVRNGAEAIRSLPGVEVSRSGGIGGLTQVRLRGAEGNHTLVLIDGVEANDTFNGEFNFSDLATDDIERIEVLRGPQSGLYGSGAVGGVINIVTRGGRGPLTFRAMGEAGSFATYGGSAGVSGGNDQVWGALSLSEQRSAGYNISPSGGEDDGASLKTLNVRAGAQIMPGVALDLSLRHTNKTGDRDDQIYEPPFFISDGLQHDTSSTFHETQWLGSARLSWDSLGGALTQALKAARNETHRIDNSYTDTTTDNLGIREDYSYTATYRFATPMLLAAHHALTGYAEHERESFTPSSDFGFGFAADGIERSRSLDAGAIEYRGDFAERLFLQGTARRDDSSQFGGYTTWRTSASLKLPEILLRPHASYGTGIKLPTMFENFGSIPGSYYANPNLRPERSEGWDAGAEVTLWPQRAFLDVTYFNDALTDKIKSFADCRVAPAPFFQECTAVNEPGKSPRQGIEVEGHFDLGGGLQLGLAYTYLDAKDALGVQEIRRPKHTARGDASYAFDGGRGLVTVTAQYVADNTDTNFGDFSTVTLDPYWLVNIGASYKVQPGVEVFGRVENVLNQQYQEVYGFETAGLAAYAGLRFTYVEPSTRDWAR